MEHDKPTEPGAARRTTVTTVTTARTRTGPHAVDPLQKLNMTRYWYYKPHPGKPHLDLTQFHPVPAGSWAAFQGTEQHLPIALLKADDAQLVKADSFFSQSYSFLGGVTPDGLSALWTELPKKHHIFCSIVLDGYPLHLYFDFDISLTDTRPGAAELARRVVGKETQVIDEFVQVFTAYFTSVFQRAPDLSRVQWETACNANKFSLHAHVITEAFADMTQCTLFMKGFSSFIEQRCRVDGAVDGESLLCVASADLTNFTHLVDFSVYSKNRNFRLFGCRKPGKAMLELFPYGDLPDQAAELPHDELVFQSMPSYCIAVDPRNYLKFAAAQLNPRKRQLTLTELFKPAPARALTVEGGRDAVPVAIRAIVQRLLRKHHLCGANTVVEKCSYHGKSRSAIQGTCAVGTAHCPLKTVFAQGDEDAMVPYVHQHTAMHFFITRYLVMCWDFKCGVDKKQRYARVASDAEVKEMFGDDGDDESDDSSDSDASGTDSDATSSSDEEEDEKQVVEGRTTATPDPVDMDVEMEAKYGADGRHEGHGADAEEVPEVDEEKAEDVRDMKRQKRDEPPPPHGADAEEVPEVDDEKAEDVRDMKRQKRDEPPPPPAARDEAVLQQHAGGAQLNMEQDDRPQLAEVQRIVAEWEDAHKKRLSKLQKRAAGGRGKAGDKKRGKAVQELRELHDSIKMDIVLYLNKYWAAIVRADKFSVLQEVVVWDEKDAKYRYECTFWPPAEFKENHVNWTIHLRGAEHECVIAYLWLKSPHRRQVDKIVFRPRPEGYVNPSAYKTFNLYRGLAINRAQAAAYCAAFGDWEGPLQYVLDHIRLIWCRGHEALYQYVVKWMASIIQRPWLKLGTAIVLRGLQGSGKGLIVNLLAAIIGKQHFFPVQDVNDVTGTYTHQLKACLLCFMDEAVWGGDKEKSGILKKLITEPTHSIHQKYLSSYVVDSFLNLIFASNHAWVVPCDEVERRYLCLDVSNQYAGAQTAEIADYFNRLRAVPAEVFAHYLYNVDLSDFNPRAIVTTEFQRDQKMRTFPIMKKWWHTQLSKGEIECRAFILNGNHRPNEEDNVRPQPTAEEEQLLAGNAWLTPQYKQYVYQSFVQHARRAAQYTADEAQFWKELRTLLPSTEQATAAGARPMMMKKYRRTIQGKRPMTVSFPSLEICRQHWRHFIVQDMEWQFDEEVEDEEVVPPVAQGGPGEAAQPMLQL